MKIIFLEAVQNFGGARKSTIEFAERLKNSGHEVLITDFWGTCDEFVAEVKKKHIRFATLSNRDSPFIITSSSPIKRLLNVVNFFSINWRLRKKFDEIADSFDPDIVIINNVKTLSILKRNNNYKICYFARGWFLPGTIPIFNKLMIKWKVDKFLAVSEATRAAIVAGQFVSIENVHVVQNAIEIDQLRSELIGKNHIISWEQEENDRPFVLFHCGGFLASKGHHITLEVAKKLKDKNINFSVIMAGIIYKGGESEKYYKSILKKIEDYSLENYIEIVVNRPNIIEYFNKVDVLIHPSYTEGLPRVVMEAMAMKKPVIGNPVGGMTDFISNNFTGFTPAFNSVDEYVKVIDRLIGDKPTYKFIYENAYNLIVCNYQHVNQMEAFEKISIK